MGADGPLLWCVHPARGPRSSRRLQRNVHDPDHVDQRTHYHGHRGERPDRRGCTHDPDHRFAHLTFVTPQDEENELAEFNTIAIIALGDGHSAGTITVTCQTVMITITETIQITIIQTTPAPCTKDERDTD